MNNSYQTEQAPPRNIMTPANMVTLVRICLVPVFVVALISPWPQWFSLPQITNDMKSLVAAGIFILISCTDLLDGYLARSRNEVTDFGKFMDPLADKILVCAALLALIELDALPSWVVLIILTREFIVAGVRMMAAGKGVVVAASWYGKAKTVSQMIAIVLFIIKDSYMVGSVHEAFHDWLWILSWVVMGIALVLTIVSMLDYIAKTQNLIGWGFRLKKNQSAKRQSQDLSCAETMSDDYENNKTAQPCSLVVLADSVLQAAREQGKTIGVAESLTGGLIAAILTEVPGASDVLQGSIVSYAATVKQSVLDVPLCVLENEGVVSEATVSYMARGARQKLNCDIAVAVTGIAGPKGADAQNPVGSVWVGCADSTSVLTRFVHLSGTRNDVRLKTARLALTLIKSMLDEQKTKQCINTSYSSPSPY